MFTQRAHGRFTIPVVPGTPHCGVDSQNCTCDYRLNITYADNALDSNGFLLDNTAFQSYFADLCRTPLSVSCENLCRKIADDLCKLCGDRATRVSVALSPFNGVEVAYTHRPVKAESTAAILREFAGVVS